MHQRDQRAQPLPRGAERLQTSPERGEVDDAGVGDGQFFNGFRCEAAAGAHRGVLDRGYQQAVPRSLVGNEAECGRERERIGFGSARGEDHVARVGPEQARDLFARLLDQVAGRAPFRMNR